MKKLFTAAMLLVGAVAAAQSGDGFYFNSGIALGAGEASFSNYNVDYRREPVAVPAIHAGATYQSGRLHVDAGIGYVRSGGAISYPVDYSGYSCAGCSVSQLPDDRSQKAFFSQIMASADVAFYSRLRRNLSMGILAGLDLTYNIASREKVSLPYGDTTFRLSGGSFTSLYTRISPWYSFGLMFERKLQNGMMLTFGGTAHVMLGSILLSSAMCPWDNLPIVYNGMQYYYTQINNGYTERNYMLLFHIGVKFRAKKGGAKVSGEKERGA